MAATASPSVRKLAAERGVEIDALAARLRRENIAREDVLAATGGGFPSTTHSTYWDVDHSRLGPVTTKPLNRMAQVAADNLAAAQACIPAVTHHDSADLTRIEAILAHLKTQGVKIAAMAFHVAVLARCLTEFPRFNASLSSDCRTLVLKGYAHIGIAVDTPGGLVVPVLRNANRKSTPEISTEIAEIAARARARAAHPT